MLDCKDPQWFQYLLYEWAVKCSKFNNLWNLITENIQFCIELYALIFTFNFFSARLVNLDLYQVLLLKLCNKMYSYQQRLVYLILWIIWLQLVVCQFCMFKSNNAPKLYLFHEFLLSGIPDGGVTTFLLQTNSVQNLFFI